MVEYRPTTLVDLVAIGTRLRAADRDELRAVHGDKVDVVERLINASLVSDDSTIAYHQGEPVAVLGVAPVPMREGVGSPWMLGTDGVMACRMDLVRKGRAKVVEWNDKFPMLLNYVDARNQRSIEWLKRIGFRLHPATAYGAKGMPFHPFVRCT